MDQIKSRDAIASEGRRAAEKGNAANPYPVDTEAHDIWNEHRNARIKEIAA